MHGFDYCVLFVLAIFLIVGTYQFYFFPQRHNFKKPIELRCKLDDMIPFKPVWVWIYSGLYYPIIIVLVLSVDSFKQFAYTALSFFCLLAMQLVFFFLLPVRVPEDWRRYETTATVSTKFLALVHSYDDCTNCFPSMHVSVATLTAYHLYANISSSIGGVAILSFAFPILIAISTLFTKQHYLADLPAGFLLGYLNYRFFDIYY